MISVFFPYKHSFAKWQELRYSLRSLDKYLKEEFQVIIVGDLPQWINRKAVIHIPHTRDESVANEVKLYDENTKLKIFLNSQYCTEKFIKMYDDIYLLREISSADILPWALLDASRDKVRNGNAAYHQQLDRTIRECIKHRLQAYCYETHLPRVFEREKMKAVFSIHGPIENRLLTSTLYWNRYHRDPKILSRQDGVKAAFYGYDDNFSFRGDSYLAIRKILSGKTFLNHNNTGLDDILKITLRILFPVKSRFEA